MRRPTAWCRPSWSGTRAATTPGCSSTATSPRTRPSKTWPWATRSPLRAWPSYDNTFNAPEGPFPRIRIRDRADIVCGTEVVDIPPSHEEQPGQAPAVSVTGGRTALQNERVPYRFTFSGTDENLAIVSVVFTVTGERAELFNRRRLRAGRGLPAPRQGREGGRGREQADRRGAGLSSGRRAAVRRGGRSGPVHLCPAHRGGGPGRHPGNHPRGHLRLYRRGGPLRSNHRRRQCGDHRHEPAVRPGSGRRLR